jgi:acyl carrier protein
MPLTGPSRRDPAAPITNGEIEELVLRAMETANLARADDAQLVISPNAAIFGPDSPLDSLGLVALILDIEDALHEAGCHVVLSDERALSGRRSPFRTVGSLVEYVGTLVRA